MAEKLALKIFWTFMLLTAATLLINIWTGKAYPANLAPWFFRIPPTFFIIGFASFLIWSPLMLYRFLGELTRRS